MEAEERAAMRDLEIGIWAKEAVCCPVCKIMWTGESIEQCRPRVANVTPRVLVCPECWLPWLELCRTNVENARRVGQLA